MKGYKTIKSTSVLLYCFSLRIHIIRAGQTTSVAQSFEYVSHPKVIRFPKTFQNTELELAKCGQGLIYLINTLGDTLYCKEWLTKLIATCSKIPRFVGKRRAVDAIYLSFCSRALDVIISHNAMLLYPSCDVMSWVDK